MLIAPAMSETKGSAVMPKVFDILEGSIPSVVGTSHSCFIGEEKNEKTA